MILLRTVEAQVRIRIPLKALQKNFNSNLTGTDFTFYAVPLPNHVLLVGEGHEKFEEMRQLAAGGEPEGDLGEGTDSQRFLFADSIWVVTATYEAKGARHALSLGIASVHLGLIPATSKKAVVRLMPACIEIWHPTNWVAAVTKANADALGYPPE